MGISKVANSDTGFVNYVYDGTDYQPVTRIFLGSVDPTTEGFTGASGDAWVPIPDADFVTQAEFDTQGPSGRELAYASSIVYQSGMTATDVTGLQISFTVTTRPVKVRTFLPLVTVVTAVPTTFFLSISDAAGTAKESSTKTWTTVGTYEQMMCEERITTPGSYTRKSQLIRFTGTGTATNNYNPGFVGMTSWIEAVEQ